MKRGCKSKENREEGLRPQADPAPEEGVGTDAGMDAAEETAAADAPEAACLASGWTPEYFQRKGSQRMTRRDRHDTPFQSHFKSFQFISVHFRSSQVRPADANVASAARLAKWRPEDAFGEPGLEECVRLPYEDAETEFGNEREE